jgi:hypothetical protein
MDSIEEWSGQRRGEKISEVENRRAILQPDQ